MPNPTAPWVVLAGLALGVALPSLTQLVAQQEPEPTPPAEAPSETPPAASPAADPSALLEQARETLINLKSLKARLVETIATGDRPFRAEGTYLQGSDLRLRLELTVQLPSLSGVLREACDGEVLWTYRQVGETARLTRRDVREIMRVASESANTNRNLLIAELGLGGLPALLASIQQTMTFDSATTEEIDGETFQIIEGTWNPEFRKQFEALPEAKGRLPEGIPDRVRIYLDSSHLPRRIVYLRTQPDDEPRPLVTLNFEDIVLNPPVTESDFQMDLPENVPTEDITHQFTERLRAPAQ